MTQYRYCAHALMRLRQRGRRFQDVDLILRYGTTVSGDGIVLRENDVARTVRELKAQCERIQRLTNWKVVMAGETVVTVYPASQRHQKRLTRQ
jgi:hypothetical protein